MKCFRVIIFLLIFFPVNNTLFSDVIVTIDDMVLNGKIIEKNDNGIIFGNYYGIFDIKRKLIKSIFETFSYQEDLNLYKKFGKNVNERDIERNFETGQKKKMERTSKDTSNINIFITPFYYRNFLDFKNILPNGYGLSLTADYNFRSFFGARIETDYLLSEKSISKINGYSLLIGPVIFFKTKICDFNFSPMAGMGYYFLNTENDIGEGFSKIKLSYNFRAIAGISFYFNNLMIMPNIRFNYVYDKTSPLVSIGAGFSVGMRF